jgi:hypothetical protein
MKGSAWEYRKNILISFQSYITPETDFALKDFSARTGRSTQSVGYGKTAMVFHMLKDLIGEEAFFVSLREFIERNSFREASWQDLQKVFQDTTGKDLDWFFRQWVDGKGCL